MTRTISTLDTDTTTGDVDVDTYQGGVDIPVGPGSVLAAYANSDFEGDIDTERKTYPNVWGTQGGSYLRGVSWIGAPPPHIPDWQLNRTLMQSFRTQAWVRKNAIRGVCGRRRRRRPQTPRGI